MKTKIVREADIERKVKAWCEVNGYLFIKMSALSARGFPDRMILKDGKVMFLELKKPGEKPRPAQQEWLSKLQRLGFNAIWADDYDLAIAGIDILFS